MKIRFLKEDKSFSFEMGRDVCETENKKNGLLHLDPMIRRAVIEMNADAVVATQDDKIVVGILYDVRISNAPFITFSEMGEKAKILLQSVQKQEVYISKDGLLAWTLWNTHHVGDRIAPQHYQDVAKVLARAFDPKR